MKKVLLLSMPFGALERPSLGLSLLKARLQEEKIHCDLNYLTFPFADFIGAENYQWMSYQIPYIAFAGDWCFTSALYDEETVSSPQNYIDNILRKTWHLSEESIARILQVRSYVPVFIDYCLNAVQWKDYAVVGFTSTFEQNIASLAMAKKIKELYPQLTIVFGGANWEGEMGHELHKQFPFVDYVCSGESEESFPALVKHIFAGDPPEAIEQNVDGIVLRKDGTSVMVDVAATVGEMNDMPYPEFSDFFDNLEKSPSSKYVFPTLLFETSRGCWWGAKSHCTFCGLNGNSMAFRSKTPRRVLEELEYLTSRWKTETVEVVDNILDMKYFDSVIPALARAKRPFQMFYEVKSNLKREHIKLLSEAGINRIQPGIESLSNHVLKLMRKGTSGLRNLQCLKWAKEYDVIAEWNLLYGFPGEKQEDYDQILEILPAVRFLHPPTATGPIRLDRFSPYFNAPADYGLINLRPLATYRYLYPFDNESLMRIAYYYEFDYESNVDPGTYARKVIDYIEWWKQNPEEGSLHMFRNTDDSLTLLDTRTDAVISECRLDNIERAIYEYCDEVHSLANIMTHLGTMFPEMVFSAGDIEKFLHSLVANRVMITDGAAYLSLAIEAQKIGDPEARYENGTIDEKRKPLISYLPRELPVLRAREKRAGTALEAACGK